jgi:hypothetical protein
MSAAEQPNLHVVDYPHDDGSPMAIWARQAREHNARRELVDLQRQTEEMREHAHRAYLAEMRRQAERQQAENTLAAARWPSPEPPGHAPAPPAEQPVPAPLEPWTPAFTPARHAAAGDPLDISTSDVQADPDDLQARADALFRAIPGAGRDTVKQVLGCTEYEAKKLCATKPQTATR